MWPIGRPHNCASFQPTKPYVATSMHQHLVDHLITHGNVDQAAHATTGWNRTPAALLQLIHGAGSSSADTEWRCATTTTMMMIIANIIYLESTAATCETFRWLQRYQTARGTAPNESRSLPRLDSPAVHIHKLLHHTPYRIYDNKHGAMRQKAQATSFTGNTFLAFLPKIYEPLWREFPKCWLLYEYVAYCNVSVLSLWA